MIEVETDGCDSTHHRRDDDQLLEMGCDWTATYNGLKLKESGNRF